MKRTYLVQMSEEDGVMTVVSATQTVKVNQYKNTTKRVRAREMARKINNSKIVIK